MVDKEKLIPQIFDKKVLLITGGTGSFGRAVLKRMLKSNIAEIRIFSRDEKKQDDLRKSLVDPKVKFYLGDVRDRRSICHAMQGVDFCFHAAALKQVPSCEFHPMQAVYTNILGTENVIDEAISAGVKRVVCLSTDKAVYPINAMGISKAMMEKVMVALSRNLEDTGTIICGTRYGNVMASRGSVIPLFINQVLSGMPITITDPTMTRFMMTLEESVELVLFAFVNGINGDIFVQKAPAATVSTLAHAILNILSKPNHPVLHIGMRHGEKLHETLLSSEEMSRAVDLDYYYRIPADGRDLNYEKFVEIGEPNMRSGSDFTSSNARQLDISGMRNLLLQLDIMQKCLRENIPIESC